MGFPILGTTISFISAPILSFCGFFLILQEQKKLAISLFYCLLFSFGFYLFGFYWIPQTLTEFGQIPFPINHILGVNALFVISPHLFIFTIVNHLLKDKILLNNFGNVLRTILFLIIQYLTPQLFSAYPGHAWIKLAPNLGLAPIFGEYIFSFFSILISFELGCIYRKKTFHKTNWAIFLLFIFLNYFLKNTITDSNVKNINVRIAQANIGNNAKLSAEKGLPNSVDRVLSTYSNLSLSPSQKPIDLIIWPETAYPFSLTSDILEKNYHQMPMVFREIIRQTLGNIFTGGYLQNTENSFANVYNSAFLITPDKQTQGYNKNRLLPFGESLPFSNAINETIHHIIPSISFFAKSSTSTLFNAHTLSGEEFKFIGFICYEALDPELLRDHLNSHPTMPNFLVNLTNDSWYGKTSEPEQHLFLSKWRTIEFGLPMIRSANTGISSIVNSNGLEEKRTSIDKIEALDYLLQVNNAPIKTIFLQFGCLPTIIISILLLIINGLLSRKTFFK